MSYKPLLAKRSLSQALLIGFLKIAAVSFILWLSWQVIDQLIILFLVLIVSATLRPLVEYFEKYRIPRAASALSLVLLLVFIIILLVQSLVTNISSEWNALATTLAGNYNQLLEQNGLDEYLGSETGQQQIKDFQNLVTSWVGGASAGVINLSLSIFSGFLSVITAIILTIYLVNDHDKIKHFGISFLPKKDHKKAMEIANRVETKLSAWLGGQLFLMTVMGLISYIGFTLIGVEFALPLAVMVGLLDIIPVIGPIIAFIPIILITLVTDPVQAIIVTIFFFSIQQLEGNILVPRIMSKSIGIDPIAVIIALMIGSGLAGAVGAILSVPIAAILMILYEEWMKVKTQRESETIQEGAA